MRRSVQPWCPCHAFAMQSHSLRISCPVLRPVHHTRISTQAMRACSTGAYGLIGLCVCCHPEIERTRTPRHLYIVSCNVGCQPVAHGQCLPPHKNGATTGLQPRFDILDIIRISMPPPPAMPAPCPERVPASASRIDKEKARSPNGLGGMPWMESRELCYLILPWVCCLFFHQNNGARKL